MLINFKSVFVYFNDKGMFKHNNLKVSVMITLQIKLKLILKFNVVFPTNTNFFILKR